MRKGYKALSGKVKVMGKGFVVEKALFMMFLIISISFVSSIGLVSAEEDSSNACCEKTDDGEYCVYTDEKDCDSDYLKTSTTCEQTSYCKVGTCVSDSGVCSDGVAKATCEGEGFDWYEGSSLEIDACQQECCVIAEYQCSYTTETNCKEVISGYEDLEFDFRDVESEAECS